MFRILSSIDSLYHLAVQDIPDIRIREVHGSPTGVSCQVIDNVPTILWDTDFWDYIGQNAFLRDTFPYDEEYDQRIIVEFFENYYGILAYHLSKRYSDYPQIRAAFIQYANEKHYSHFKEIYPKAVEVSDFNLIYELEMMVCKLMVLYHEIAHLLFRRDPKLKTTVVEMVISNVKGFLLSEGKGLYDSLLKRSSFKYDIEYIRNVYRQFVSGDERYDNLIEEMAADFYALSKTHATVLLNFRSFYSTALSDSILSGIILFYTHIASYERICSYWDSLIPLVLLKNYKASDSVENILKDKGDFNYIRTHLYQIIQCEVVYKLDEANGYSDGYSKFSQRLKKVVDRHNINENWRARAYLSMHNDEVFNRILYTANQMDSENDKCELEVFPENELLISWISNQYHNYYGLKLINEEGKPYEALNEFSISVYIMERYLGHYSRFTARAYNNVVTALFSLYKKDLKNKRMLEEAKYYSVVSIDIIKHIGLLNDNFATPYFQNAGVIAQWSGDYEKAIDLYSEAKKRKLKIYEGEYNYSIALTDSSLAATYYDMGNIKEAKKLSEKVIDYLKDSGMTNTSLYGETLPLYLKCKSIDKLD